MRIRVLSVLMLLIASPASSSAEETSGDATAGARTYRVCAACHSLRPGVHLSGPSLAGLWGKAAAAITDFSRYTTALKEADLTWDAATLDAWLDRPDRVAPGTSMTFRGLPSSKTRANLIAFLEKAMATDGAEAVVKSGLLSKELADGRLPPVLKSMPTHQRVTDVRHCKDGYHLTTADGRVRPIWETNLRIKIDTSERGPIAGQPILLASGQGGDRFTIVFSDVTEIASFIKHAC